MKGLIEMKFTPEVIAALETLRKNAENDFELHRISVLEKDLIAPPVVEIVDDTHQKFNGIVYAKNTSGHYSNKLGIHRAIYAYYFGKIPENNYNIHHRDFNPANNDISNLQLLSIAEHAKIHKQPNFEEKICPICNKKFTTTKHQQIFCSRSCFGKHYSKNKKKLPVEKTCPVCGKKFILRYQNFKRVCCSPSCAKKYSWTNGVYDVSVEKECSVCGTKFTAKSKRAMYCSKNCADKASAQKRKLKNN